MLGSFLFFNSLFLKLKNLSSMAFSFYFFLSFFFLSFFIFSQLTIRES